MKKKNLKWDIYNYIKTNEKLPSHDKSEDSKYAYHCKILKEEGSIINLHGGVWKVIGDFKTKKSTSKKLITSKHKQTRFGTKNKRGHGFTVSIQLPEIKNWKKRAEHFKKINFKFEPIKQGQKVNVRGYNVWICSQSLKIHFPKYLSIFSESARKSRDEAYLLSFSICKHLESKLNVNFKINKQYMIRDSYGHYGEVGNELAKQLHKERKQMFVYGYDGKVWLTFDYSWKQFLEAETIHKERAVEDMDDVISPFFNDLRENPTTISKVRNEVGEQRDILLKTQKQLEMQSMLITTLMNEIKKKL